MGWNSRWLLGTYSVLLVIMLLVQAAVAITLFADESWRNYLPPDQTGEFHKVLHKLAFKYVLCHFEGTVSLWLLGRCMMTSLSKAYIVPHMLLRHFETVTARVRGL